MDGALGKLRLRSGKRVALYVYTAVRPQCEAINVSRHLADSRCVNHAMEGHTLCMLHWRRALKLLEEDLK